MDHLAVLDAICNLADEEEIIKVLEQLFIGNQEAMNKIWTLDSESDDIRIKNITNKLGFHPTGGLSFLHMAAFMKKPKIVAWLLNNGADSNVCCCEFVTPLHFALLASNNHEAIKILLPLSIEFQVSEISPLFSFDTLNGEHRDRNLEMMNAIADSAQATAQGFQIDGICRQLFFYETIIQHACLKSNGDDLRKLTLTLESLIRYLADGNKKEWISLDGGIFRDYIQSRQSITGKRLEQQEKNEICETLKSLTDKGYIRDNQEMFISVITEQPKCLRNSEKKNENLTIEFLIYSLQWRRNKISLSPIVSEDLLEKSVLSEDTRIKLARDQELLKRNPRLLDICALDEFINPKNEKLSLEEIIYNEDIIHWLCELIAHTDARMTEERKQGCVNLLLKYETLSEEKKQKIKLSVLQHKVNELEAAAIQALPQEDHKVSQLEESLRLAESKLGEKTITIKKYDDELAASQSTINKLTEENNRLMASFQEASQQQEQFKRDMDQQLKEKSDKEAAASRELSALQETVKGLRDDLGASQSTVKASNRTVATFQKASEQQNQFENAMVQQLKEKSDKEDAASQKLSALEEKIKGLSADLKTSQSTVNRLIEDNKTLKESLEKTSRQLNILEKNTPDILRQLQEKRDELAGVRQQLFDLQGNANGLTAENHRLPERQNINNVFDKRLRGIRYQIMNHNYQLNGGGVKKYEKKYSNASNKIRGIIESALPNSTLHKEEITEVKFNEIKVLIQQELEGKMKSTNGRFFSIGKRDVTTSALYENIQATLEGNNDTSLRR
jgi:ankyrin repeat protein/archaellum component FlaC